MTKREAEDMLFIDGSPCYRHIQDALSHIEAAIDWQEKRLEASRYLWENKLTTEGGYTGKELHTSELLNMEYYRKMKNLIEEYNTKVENEP